jgi:hypothetical protein
LRDFVLRLFSLLAEITNFGLIAVFLLCLVSELQKQSSPGLEPMISFWGSGLRLCNLLFESNNLGLAAVLLSA